MSVTLPCYYQVFIFLVLDSDHSVRGTNPARLFFFTLLTLDCFLTQ